MPLRVQQICLRFVAGLSTIRVIQRRSTQIIDFGVQIANQFECQLFPHGDEAAEK
jgi:hypothetical protein